VACVGQEGLKEGGEDNVDMVGGSHWCECEGEDVGCTSVQTKLLWLSFALGMANRDPNGLGGS
jgi:hypothetical protein